MTRLRFPLLRFPAFSRCFPLAALLAGLASYTARAAPPAVGGATAQRTAFVGSVHELSAGQKATL